MDCAPADIRNGHCFGTWGRIEQHKDLGLDWHCPIEMREPQRQSAVFQSPHLKKINRLLKMSVSQDFDRKRILKRNSQKKKKLKGKKKQKIFKEMVCFHL